MSLGKSTNLAQSGFVHAAISINAARLTLVWQTAKLADAPQQRLSCSAKGAVSPARVLPPWISFPPLQDPLQWVVNDSPARVKLRYEAI
jgi:hypothetical protein